MIRNDYIAVGGFSQKFIDKKFAKMSADIIETWNLTCGNSIKE